MSYAQNNSATCGFTLSNAERAQYQSVMTQLRNNPQQGLANAPVSASIPIYFWVNNPNGQINASELEQMVDKANTYFNFPNNTRFMFCGVSYPNDSRWYTMNGADNFTNVQVFNAYNKPNVINVYVARYPVSAAVGTAKIILGNPFILTINGAEQFAHELGHSFGLLHTFEDAGRQKELVIREETSGKAFPLPNWETAADMMKSTPAQPYICQNFCPASSCNAVDDNGDAYNYLTTNLMSYTYSCATGFTQEQQNKMNLALTTNLSFLVNAPCGEEVAGFGQIRRSRLASSPSDECFSSGNDLNIYAKNATVTIQNNSSGATLCSLIPNVNNGYYQSCNFPKNSSITITPSKNSNYKEGVDATDASLIARHILDISPFVYPFQLLAADVDNSGEIDGLDVLHIRRLLRGTVSTFPNGVGSWRFVPSKFYSNPTFLAAFKNDPFTASFGGMTYNGSNSYMDKITLDMSVSNNFKEDNWGFLPYKVGDVNYCETTYGFTGPNYPPTEPVSLNAARVASTQYRISTPRTMSMRRVEEKTIVLKAKTAASVAALQIGINFLKDKFSIKEIEKGDFGSENDVFDFNKEDKGKLRVLWSNKNGNAKSIRVGTILLKAKVKANTDINDLLTVLNIDNQVLKTKFYDEEGRLVPMDLEWDDDDDAVVSNPLTVNVFPNPFRNDVSLEINSPVAGSATITLSNIITRQSIVLTRQLVSGSNVVNISNTTSLSTGMLTYSVVVGARIVNGAINKTR